MAPPIVENPKLTGLNPLYFFGPIRAGFNQLLNSVLAPSVQPSQSNALPFDDKSWRRFENAPSRFSLALLFRPADNTDNKGKLIKIVEPFLTAFEEALKKGQKPNPDALNLVLEDIYEKNPNLEYAVKPFEERGDPKTNPYPYGRVVFLDRKFTDSTGKAWRLHGVVTHWLPQVSDRHCHPDMDGSDLAVSGARGVEIDYKRPRDGDLAPAEVKFISPGSVFSAPQLSCHQIWNPEHPRNGRPLTILHFFWGVEETKTP